MSCVGAILICRQRAALRSRGPPACRPTLDRPNLDQWVKFLGEYIQGRPSSIVRFHDSSSGPIESREISEGVVLDYDAAGNVVGIDIDNASQKVALNELTLSKLPFILQTITA